MIGTLGLGLAIAMIADGLFSAKAVPPPLPEPSSVPPVLEDEEQEEKEEEVPVAHRKQKGGRKRMDYAKMYKKKLDEEKAEEDAKIVAEINADAYLGDDTSPSRRAYLISKAYKEARAKAPVVAVGYRVDSDDGVDEWGSELDDVLSSSVVSSSSEDEGDDFSSVGTMVSDEEVEEADEDKKKKKIDISEDEYATALALSQMSRFQTAA